jgi:orotate phosphoribosyltransferase-like protein
VRRACCVRDRPIKEICRELHVSRNTVRTILRSGETEFVHERSVHLLPREQVRCHLVRLGFTLRTSVITILRQATGGA